MSLFPAYAPLDGREPDRLAENKIKKETDAVKQEPEDDKYDRRGDFLGGLGSHKRNSRKQEIRIMEERKKKRLLEKTQKKLEMYKELLANRSILDEDSDDEDNIPMVISDLPSHTISTGFVIRHDDELPSTSYSSTNRVKRRSRSWSPSESSEEGEIRHKRRRRSPSRRRSRSRSRSPSESSEEGEIRHKRRRRSPSRDSSPERKSKKVKKEKKKKHKRKHKKKGRSKHKRSSPSSSSSSSSNEDETKTQERKSCGLSRPSRNEKYAFWKPGEPITGCILNSYVCDDETASFDRVPPRERSDVPETAYSSVLGGRGDSFYEGWFPREVKKVNRFYHIKFNPKKLENTFDEEDSPLDERVTVFNKPYKPFKYLHELEDERRAAEENEEIVMRENRQLTNLGERLSKEEVDVKVLIRANPKDKSLYIRFINLQDEIFESNRESGLQSNDKMAVNERKISILDDAISKFPRESDLYLMRIALLEEMRGPDAVAAEWQKMTHTFVNSCAVWEKYLDSIQFSSTYSAKKLDAAFDSCLTKLNGIMIGVLRSHKKEPETENFMLKVYIRRLHWWLESGNYARAVASVQANLEYNFLCNDPVLPHSLSQRRQLLKEYWETGLPRVGERGYTSLGGWVNYYKAKSGNANQLAEMMSSLPHLKAYEQDLNSMSERQAGEKIMTMSGSIDQKWVAHERMLAAVKIFPLHDNTDVTDENVEDVAMRFIPFEDLSVYDFWKCEHFAKYVMTALGGKFINFNSPFVPLVLIAREIGLKFPGPSFPPEITDVVYRMMVQIAHSCKDPEWAFAAITSLSNIMELSPEREKKKMKIIKDRIGALTKSQELVDRFSDIHFEFLEQGPFRALKDYLALLTVVDSTWAPETMKKNYTEKVVGILIDKCNLDNITLKTMDWNSRSNFLASVLLACRCITSSAELAAKLSNWVLLRKKTTLDGTEPLEAINILKECFVMECPESDIGKYQCLSVYYGNLKNVICALKLLLNYAKGNKEGSEWLNRAKRDMISIHGVPDELVHRSLIQILHMHMREQHSHRSDLLQEMTVHCENFPFSSWALRKIVELLSGTSPTISYRKCDFYRALKKRYPNLDVEIGKFRSLAIIATCLGRAQSDNDGVCELISVNDFLSNACATFAREQRDAFLWRLSLALAPDEKEKEKIHTLATGQCRWSRELHLDRIMSSTSGFVPENIRLLMTEKDIPIFQQMDEFEVLLEAAESRNAEE